MKEEWKKIDNYPNYSVSNLGNVRNDKRRKLVAINKQNGSLKLSDGGIIEKKTVGNLVAKAFMPESKESFGRVKHIDGDCNNNQVDNLQWLTIKERNNINVIYCKDCELFYNCEWTSGVFGYCNKAKRSL